MKYYKILNEDMTSPYDGKTKWAVGEVTRLSNQQTELHSSPAI